MCLIGPSNSEKYLVRTAELHVAARVQFDDVAVDALRGDSEFLGEVASAHRSVERVKHSLHARPKLSWYPRFLRSRFEAAFSSARSGAPRLYLASMREAELLQNEQGGIRFFQT